MITAELEAEPVVDGVDVVDGIDGVSGNDPDSEYEYPPELIERWVRETEISKLKIASGEIKPQSVREAAAKYGVILD